MSPEGSPCPICTADATGRLLRWTSELDIHRCAACEVLFTQPLPSERELYEYYQNFAYKKPRVDQIGSQLQERQTELRELFGLNGADHHGRTFLDQGGGAGVAYAAARELGLESHFGDINEQAIGFVRETFGLEPDRLVRDLSRHPGNFDYIFSDNVIEHVPDPRGFVAQLLARLAPGGTVIIKTPNAAASETYFYPRLAFQYAKRAARHNGWRRSLELLVSNPVWACDPPRHLYSFSPASLAKLAESLDLPSDRYAIDHYWTPLLANTFTERALRPRKSVWGQLRRASAAPIVALELASKAGQLLARRRHWIEPGGLILRITRPLR